jgi:hypothetical protein
LACAARESSALTTLRYRKGELGEQRMTVAQGLLAGHAEGWREQRQVLIGAQQIEQARLLWTEADASVHGNMTAVGTDQPGADREQRALSGTVLADDRDSLAGAHRQRDVVENEPAGVGLADRAGLELRRSLWLEIGCIYRSEALGRKGDAHEVLTR